jgi:hypothetical protein
MPKLPIKTETFDMKTGKKTGEHITQAMIMPPAADKCQVCARPIHGNEAPHDATSLYYQYQFYGQHERWPNWKDAMADCPDDVKAKWIAALEAKGVDVEAGKVLPEKNKS